MTVPDRRVPLKEDTVLVIRRGRKLARAVAIRPGGSAPRGYRTGVLFALTNTFLPGKALHIDSDELLTRQTPPGRPSLRVHPRGAGQWA